MLKLFQFIQTKFAILGFIPNQQSPLNGKTVAALICFWLDNAFNCVFIAVEVDNFVDYTNSIFIICATTGIATCFTIAMIKARKLFELIDFAEKIADRGEKYFAKNAHCIANWL